MMPLFAGSLVLMLVVFLLLLRGVQSRMQAAHYAVGKSVPVAARYRPMLRLLTERSVAPKNSRVFRARRRAIFRKYLRCLTRDYAGLLAGVRVAMVESGVDRPDLAKALAKNRFLFTMALCRIEISLAAHAAGLDSVQTPDLSGLIAGIDVLRAQLSVFEPNFAPSR